LPEAFKKLLTSSATNRWNLEIQEGIYDMLELFVELVAAKLKGDSVVPVSMLNVLATAFDPNNDWNKKNKDRSSRGRWENRNSATASKDFAHPPKDLFVRSRYGWLCDLINAFGEKGGFDLIYARFDKDEEDKPLSAQEMAALLGTVASCSEMLEKDAVQKPLAACMERIFKLVGRLEASELKGKEMTAVSDLLASVKSLCVRFWPQHADRCDDERLDIVCKMLKRPQFHCKMAALKEVSRLIEESRMSGNSNKGRKFVTEGRVVEWMADNSVLSVALEGNVDQVQYTDKIQAIVEFLGPRLSNEELGKMWRTAEKSSNPHVADNVRGMLAGAAARLSLTQLEHLTDLAKESWEKAGNRGGGMARERLLDLIGQIGREASVIRSKQLILELLWDLSHVRDLQKHLVEKALAEQLNILSEINFNKDANKRAYVMKCVEHLKKGEHVALAVKHLHDICKSYLKGSSSYHKPDKVRLNILNLSIFRVHYRLVDNLDGVEQAARDRAAVVALP